MWGSRGTAHLSAHKHPAALAAAWQELEQPSAVQGPKGNLPPKAPAAPRTSVLGQISVTGQPKGPCTCPASTVPTSCYTGGEFPGNQGIKQHREHPERLKVNPCAPHTFQWASPDGLLCQQRWSTPAQHYQALGIFSTARKKCFIFKDSAKSCQEGDWADQSCAGLWDCWQLPGLGVPSLHCSVGGR